ncbi:mitochondrial carrier domain-containing protein [Pisolithus albus]|nr:mitochondrial carrier domain-containing protein [Pisolithus albus]
MAEEVDYETLPSNAGLGVNMIAGAMAGITEHAVMFPIDSIKTRMQVFATTPAAVYTGIGNAFTRISSTEGMRALWRGVSSVILGAGPAHAVHFGTYEFVKDFAGGRAGGNQPLTTAVAGAAATIASDALMNPFDGELPVISTAVVPIGRLSIILTVIKQRMQVHQSEFRSVFTAMRVVYRNEGLAAFYVSYPTTLMMSVPFTAAQFTVYEQVKRLLNPRGEYSPSSHVIAGALAGGVAAGVTTPLDVAKTLLQTRGTSKDTELRRVRGMWDAFRIVWMRDGIKGFFRGMSPRMLMHMPSNALCWLSYEFFKVAIRE